MCYYRLFLSIELIFLPFLYFRARKFWTHTQSKPEFIFSAVRFPAVWSQKGERKSVGRMVAPSMNYLRCHVVSLQNEKSLLLMTTHAFSVGGERNWRTKSSHLNVKVELNVKMVICHISWPITQFRLMTQFGWRLPVILSEDSEPIIAQSGASPAGVHSHFWAKPFDIQHRKDVRNPAVFR